jgi:hypothetical protein
MTFCTIVTTPETNTLTEMKILDKELADEPSGLQGRLPD